MKSWAILFFAICLQALGQNYAVDWYKISGGGGTSTNGQYALSGTIGQHDTGGQMTGGNFSLTGGFWALYAVQILGAPLLHIYLTTTNTAIVWWAAPSTGWTLQQTPALNTTGWVNTTNAINAINGQNQITVLPPTGCQFFRLVQP